MDKRIILVGILFLSLVVTACGAIPTLPPPESTVSIRTPRITYLPGTAHTEPDPSQSTVPDSSPTAAVTSLPFTATVNVEATSTLQPPTATHTPAADSTEKPELTNTPTIAPSATMTATREPSATPEPTFTATPLPYQVQIRNPLYLENFVHTEQGCSWLGAAGQVFNREGAVVKNIVIRAGGTLDGSEILETMTMPLADPDDDRSYGPGGFELQFAESPYETENQVWVQLFDLGGAPLSEKIFLKTFDDCQKNLILLNFIEQ